MSEPGPALATPSQVTYRLGSYEVTVPTRFGPRLLGLRANGSDELLVRLDREVAIEEGVHGTFRFRGGHRLWAAPERPDLTYAPDDAACTVSYENGLLSVTGSTDPAGFRKKLEVRMDEGGLVVDHVLEWHGPEPVMAGAWGITQLPLGGTALLPVGGRDGSASRLQADRSLVLWPYTDLADPRLSFAPAAAIVRARRGGRFKLGSSPMPRRLGYLRDGWLFTKSIDPAGAGSYADRAAVGQVFVNEHFCELESLGPLADLEPGQTLRHTEVWQVVGCPDLDSAVERIAATQ